MDIAKEENIGITEKVSATASNAKNTVLKFMRAHEKELKFFAATALFFMSMADPTKITAAVTAGASLIEVAKAASVIAKQAEESEAAEKVEGSVETKQAEEFAETKQAGKFTVSKKEKKSAKSDKAEPEILEEQLFFDFDELSGKLKNDLYADCDRKGVSRRVGVKSVVDNIWGTDNMVMAECGV